MIRTLFCFLFAAQIHAADPRLGSWKLVSVEATMDPPRLTTIPVGESKLDDRDYPFPASRAYDQISGRRTDANTVDGVLKKDGKEAATYRFQVSERDPDRLRMTTAPIGGAPTGGLNTDQLYTRKGQSPDSGNKVIGVWVRDESQLARDELRAFRFTAEGANSVHFEATGGPSYTATLDGKESTSIRNSRADSVTVQVLDANTVQETRLIAGQVIATFRFVVSDHGETLTLNSVDVYPDGRKKTIKAIFRKE